MRNDYSPRRNLDLRRTMTDARQWLVEAEDNPFTTDADRVAELAASPPATPPAVAGGGNSWTARSNAWMPTLALHLLQ